MKTTFAKPAAIAALVAAAAVSPAMADKHNFWTGEAETYDLQNVGNWNVKDDKEKYPNDELGGKYLNISFWRNIKTVDAAKVEFSKMFTMNGTLTIANYASGNPPLVFTAGDPTFGLDLTLSPNNANKGGIYIAHTNLAYNAKNYYVGLSDAKVEFKGGSYTGNNIHMGNLNQPADYRAYVTVSGVDSAVTLIATNNINLLKGSLTIAGENSVVTGKNISVGRIEDKARPGAEFNVYMRGGAVLAAEDTLFLGGWYNSGQLGTGKIFAENSSISSAKQIHIAGYGGVGEMHVTNCTVKVAQGGNLHVGRADDSTGVYDMNGGTLDVGNNFVVCAGNDSTGTFKMSGGTLTVGNAVYLGGAGSGNSGRKDTKAKFIMTGGTATSASNTEIGNFTGSTTGGYALLSLSGRASYTARSNLQMGAANGRLEDQTWLAVTNGTMTVSGAVYINGGIGGIALGDGAHFTVTHDNGICTADGGRGYAQVGGDFAITIGAGSVLQTKKFQYDRSSRAKNQDVAIAFEGGTLRAGADAAQFIPAKDRLTVTVNSNGGIIDTNGKSVTIPANIAAAGGAASGDLKVTGSGTVTLTGSLAFGGAIDKSPETSLKLSGNSAVSLFGADGGGLRLASDAAAGTVLFTYSEAPESEPDAAMLLAIRNGLSYADAAKEAATPAKRAFRAVYDATAMQVKLGAPLGVILLAR